MSYNGAQIKDRAREILGRDISDQEAGQIMNATGGGQEDQVVKYLQSNKPGPNPTNITNDFISSLVNPIFEELKQFEQRVKDFGLEGPFAFDEAQARAVAEQTSDPYYDQILKEFVSGVDMKRKQGQDQERELLANLTREKEYEKGEARKNIEDAISSTEQGFESRGLFDSGLRRRAVGRIEGEGNLQGQRADELGNAQASNIQRSSADVNAALNLDESIGKRKIGTERSNTIENIVENQRREQQQTTEVERLQSYALPFVQRSEDALNRLLQFA